MTTIKDEQGDPVPPCAPEVCKKLEPKIAHLCSQNQWPPDYQIMIMWDDKLCFCLCR
ncbi:hypothetical protein ACVIJ6_005371 [Bradyrhizobium sp. USDA 4369]